MVNQHFPEIDAEYCLAEGGNVTRGGGKVKYASVQAVEKIPREQLTQILKHALDPKDPTQRLRIVRLYLQSERFRDARIELEHHAIDDAGGAWETSGPQPTPVTGGTSAPRTSSSSGSIRRRATSSRSSPTSSGRRWPASRVSAS